MSYLHLPSVNIADFNKGTISLWFRFSDDSVQNAKKHFQNYPFKEDAPEILKGTIPLITFGRKIMAHCYHFESRKDGEFTGPPPWEAYHYEAYSYHPVQLGDQPCPPSHIGIDCSGTAPTLVFFFQMETRPEVQGLLTERTEVHWEGTHPPFQQYQTVTDISYTRVGQPGSFLINPDFEVEPDKWHHVLASFDFSAQVDVVALQRDPHLHNPGDSIQSACTFWYAFDDENKDGQDNMGDAWAYKQSNRIISQGALEADQSYIPFNDPFTTGGDENPEYRWSVSPVPMNESAMGLPASAEYVETIYHCEQAELQFFAGLVLNTSDINNRRAFVDNDGIPVPPDETEKLLGMRPHILLHGTSNWQAGENTGSLGTQRMTEGEDSVIPSGQFTPVALIKEFEPDPSLEKVTA